MDTQNQLNQLPSNISINLQNCTGCTITVTPNGQQVNVKKRHTLLPLMGTLLIPFAKVAGEALKLFGASP
jgi:hypothetical protein